MMKHAVVALAAVPLALSLCAAPLDAQDFSVGLRGGVAVPSGGFAGAEHREDAFLAGAENGLGMGLDLTFGLGRRAALYAGFDHIRFDCATERCGSGGRYVLGGAAVGLRFLPGELGALTPWLRGGVTFNELEGEFAGTGSRLITNRAPGFEVGAGLDFPLLRALTVSPQARYVGQNFRYRIPGTTSPERTGQTVGYFTFEVGVGIGRG